MITSIEAEAFLKCEAINRKHFIINGAKTIFDSGNNVVTFIYKEDPKLLERLQHFGNETLFILSESLRTEAQNITDKMILFSPTPKLDFARLVRNFFCKKPEGELIHNEASIHPDARLHSSVRIGANCIIGACSMGENCFIEENTIVTDGAVLGNNVHIRQNCIIGAEDFGPIRLEDNGVILFPQIGNVIIEDNVEIFAGTIVGRGTLAATTIKKGVKIDAMCQIGHNTFIGENTVITAGSIILGSAKIGKNSYIGSHSVIRNECSIGDTCLVGMGSVVTKSFGDNVMVVGNPARFVRPNDKPFNF
jgi:UDP-3-O-[3-hydroxymyristoyl] glucosamine N-acyltransferase